ncbi:MAG: hypothetical protein PHY54_03815 [Methylococcales bacterium]|nr:hypothetical protein [Methylococcales bacterium]
MNLNNAGDIIHKKLAVIVSVRQNKKVKSCPMKTFNLLPRFARFHIYIALKKQISFGELEERRGAIH